jgi:predicted GH43/DUF377 family glycosyl hydrolase
MARFEGNPILKPLPFHDWESKYVFNPAMFSLDGKIHYLYRAMGVDHVSRLGYASSKDGFQIDERLDYPVFEPINTFEKNGCEDPRITVMGDTCYMTFTAFSDIPQVGITTISSEDFLNKNWDWGERIYPFFGTINKNAALFPKKHHQRYVMLHRLEPNIYITYSNDLRNWTESNLLACRRKNSWDCVKIGAAGPPLEISDGWLQIYHGVSQNKVYRLGALILDKYNPEKILYRTENPFIEPNEEYECCGLVPNVVFSCGGVIQNDKVLISYGCADTVIGISSFTLDEVLYS